MNAVMSERESESGPGCLAPHKQVLRFLILTSSPQLLEFFLVLPIKVREMTQRSGWHHPFRAVRIHSFISCLYLPAFVRPRPPIPYISEGKQEENKIQNLLSDFQEKISLGWSSQVVETGKEAP